MHYKRLWALWTGYHILDQLTVPDIARQCQVQLIFDLWYRQSDIAMLDYYGIDITPLYDDRTAVIFSSIVIPLWVSYNVDN